MPVNRPPASIKTKRKPPASKILHVDPDLMSNKIRQRAPNTPLPSSQTMVSEDGSHEPSLDSSEIAWQIQQYDPPSKKDAATNKDAVSHKETKDEEDNKINIKIGFRLFVAGKNKQEKKIWLPINSTEDFSIEVMVGTTTFDEYQKMVINACNKAFPNSSPIIKKDLTARAPQIKWYGTIPKTPNFLKKDKYEVTDHASYSNWVETAYDVSRSEIGLLLKMSNPAEAIKRAQREDLLAAQADHEEAVQIAAAKRKASDGDDDDPDANADDELDPVDWERINTHMKKIYAANLTNVKYDQHLPVYIDLTNPHRYILITLEACEEWARALMARKEGVSAKTPPSSLVYRTLSPAKRAQIAPGGLDGSNSNAITPSNFDLLSTLFASRQYHTTRAEELSDRSLSPPPDEPDMEGYLYFLKIRNKEDVLEKLLANGFDSHKLFKSAGLLQSEVKDLGIPLGVVTALFDNVSKYTRFQSLIQ
ncbi:hypothetical protein PCANC_12183 [Puccinia coronata f. sp. avenae]|uniref:Uncharacterized protein n=1 Tax=Puccinia coronata f. sp. avenae TaxID=200324 RepID=A0A2N5VF54_9BASI|nr:hypothetical protein PCANC_12183 [Puccinia coronata f. sp. avenae]